jgi:4-carboxymuconolactone decarboxylase
VTPAIRAEPWDPAVRQAQGQAAFKAIMTMPGPPPTTAYQQGGILNFVFGEMWQRPGLDQRSRRWITLVGVSKTGETIPIRSHIHAAMKSGDATLEEMQEFVLQYAIYGGWPSGSTIQAAVLDQSERLARGENFQ